MAKPKKMTEKQDAAADRRAGIKDNSPRDQKLDAARRLPADDKKKKPFGK